MYQLIDFILIFRLASHLADYECFQIELAKGYGVAEWREDIKKVMLNAGLKDNLKSTIIFFYYL